MLAAKILIYAKIVYIQGLNIGQNRVIQMLLIDAEAIALHISVVINRNQNRTFIILQYFFQLSNRILASDFKNIRSAVMMNKAYLRE